MLHIDITGNLNISTNPNVPINLDFGNNYLFMSPNLYKKDIMALIYIAAFKSEHPVVMVSKNPQTLINYQILHKIYRKSRKMAYRNVVYGLTQKNSYALIPDIDKNEQGYKSAGSGLYIQFIDVDNLNTQGIDINQFTSMNAINIFFSTKDVASMGSFTNIFTDYSQHKILFKAEREIYSKVRGVIRNEELLDKDTINVLDSEFRAVFAKWLANGRDNLRSFENLELGVLSNEEQVSAIGNMTNTLLLDIERRIAQTTRDVYQGLTEFEDSYTNTTLFNSLNEETYQMLLKQDI